MTRCAWALCLMPLIHLSCYQATNQIISPRLRNTEAVFTDNDYGQLLQKFPLNAQAMGPDPYLQEPREHLEIYAILLSAESRRWAATGALDAIARVRSCALRLLETSDLDGDGKVGWGLPFAWDAFGDGSVNSVNHPYTISTAQTLEAFLDALEYAPNLFSIEEKRQLETTIANAWKRWSREAWTDFSPEFGWFWYSPAISDSWNVVNINGMMLSVAIRCRQRTWKSPGLLEFADLDDRIHKMARLILAEMEPRNGLPFWHYIPTPNALNQDEPNDIVHHVYILWGMERYRTYSSEPLPYTKEQALESVATYFSDTKAFDYPQDVIYSGPKAPYQARPMVLWGMGAALAFLGENQMKAPSINDLTKRLLKQEYGPWPELTLWPKGFSSGDTATFYPRYADHVLWGLACHKYPPAR